jgi:HSP20 family protein
MDYIKIRFGNDFDPVRARIEKTIEDIFRPRPISPMFSSREHCWTPQMDIYDTPEQIILRAELAGVEKDDLEIEINSKAIRIHGQRKELPRVPDSSYRLAEIQYGRFERIIYLPAPVDTEVVASSYVNGFLELRLAKRSRDTSFSVPITEE